MARMGKPVSRRRANANVKHQRRQTIRVFTWIVQKRVDAHTVDEHKHITEQDRQRVPDEEILEPFAS